jgi:Tfp pilus assembly protein PilX
MTRLRIKRANDGGYALMAVLAIMLVLLSAVAALTLMAIRTATNTGRFRDRASAISAAEGQVDAMVSTITAAVTASPTAPAWPCTPDLLRRQRIRRWLPRSRHAGEIGYGSKRGDESRAP